MQAEKSFFSFAFELTGDVEDSARLEERYNKDLDIKSDELARQKAEEIFETKKEAYRLEVIKEINEANITAKGAEISRSPYISKEVESNGKTLTRQHFVPEGIVRDPAYDGEQLIYNDCVHNWQRLKSKGGRDYVSDFVVSVIVVVNATGPGQCDAIAVCLQGVEKPLIFKDGVIDLRSVKRETAFCQKGLKHNGELMFQSFIRAMKKCKDVFFLTIPEHVGGVLLYGGVYSYTSMMSMISGLETLYPEEIKQHQLLQHDRRFEEVVADYRARLPNVWQLKLAVTIRVMSILLPFYEAYGLKPDRFFVLSPSDEKGKDTLISLTSRFNYTAPVVTSVSSRINTVRSALEIGNDMTTVFSYAYGIDNKQAFLNALREIYMDVKCENSFKESTRKIILLFTDVPGSVPEEYPAYYLSFAEDIRAVDIQDLRHLSGELDFSFIQLLVNNPDVAKALIRQAQDEAKELLTSAVGTEHTETMTMLIATSILLIKLGIISGADQQAILSWFGTEATSRTTITEDVGQRFKVAVSGAILSGELKVAKQSGPPYYTDDGQTVFIADTDGSINFTDAVLQKVILPQIPTVKNVAQLNKRLIEKGWVISTHTNKRQLKVTYDSGVHEQIEVFSYRRKVMNTEAKAIVDDMIYDEFWFDIGEVPNGFVPVLCNADGSKVAGYVLNAEMDINRHEMYFGISRSGKSFALLQTALMRAKQGETVLIFDQSGSFTESELEKHLGKSMVKQYFCLWNVYQDGLPVNITSLQGCQDYKEKKERIVRMYALMTRSLGSYEEKILNHAVKHMLRDKTNQQPDLASIINYICKDGDMGVKSSLDEAHRKLIYKIDAMLDDLDEIQDSSYNWIEFVEKQGKPIFVISTGADTVGKSTELIDMLLESLYNFKQCNPSERYTVVIDEAQDLYLHEKGAVNTLLRKVGKDSTSMLLASQTFPDPNTPFGKVMGNCGRVRGYRPKANDVMLSAKLFACDSREGDALRQGECFDKGEFYSRYRNENATTTLKGRTAQFADIFKQE